MKKTNLPSYRISEGTSYILSHLPQRIRVSFSRDELLQQDQTSSTSTTTTSTCMDSNPTTEEELLDFELICQETIEEQQQQQQHEEEKEEQEILSIHQKGFTINKFKSKQQEVKFPWRCELCQKSFHFFRGRYKCNLCMVFICRTCSKSVNRNIHHRTCLLCLQIESYEEMIEQAFIRMPCWTTTNSTCSTYSTSSTTRRSMTTYTGIPRQIYVKWFQQLSREGKVSTLLFPTKSDPKNPAFRHRYRRSSSTCSIEFERIPWRHILHGSMWISYCRMLKETLQVDVCFMSVVDTKHELIVSSAGGGQEFGTVGGGGGHILPFTCFPRDISICNYTMANINGLLIPNVQEDDFFGVNPMLYALQAKFYAGFPICCHQNVIGTLVILDTQKPKQFVQVDNLHLLKTTSCAISKRMDTLVDNLQNKYNIRLLEQTFQLKKIQEQEQTRQTNCFSLACTQFSPRQNQNRHSL
jgi:hypothetical protein